MERKFVLGERAAAALRPIIANGAKYGSRPRRIANDPSDQAGGPYFLECRIFADGPADEETGERTKALRMYLGPQGDYPASLRINGKPAPLSLQQAKIRADGWYELGNPESVEAVWLVPVAIPGEGGNYYNAANQSYSVLYTPDTTGTSQAPGVAPGNAPNNDWPRWLRPLLIATVSGSVRVGQGLMNGAEITIEVGDADGTHSGAATPGPGVAGGFCSIEQNGLQQFQLYRFSDTTMNLVVDEAAALAAGIDLVVRKAGYVGQQGESIDKARVMYVQLSQLIELLRTFTGEDIPAWLASHMPEVAILFRNYVESNDGPFWLSGGNASTCYGSDIADQNHDLAIDIDSRELKGAWGTEANKTFSVGGPLDVAGSVTAPNGSGNFGGTLETASDLTVGANASVGGNLTVTGDADVTVLTASQINSNSDANIAANASVGADLTVGGDVSVTGDITADTANAQTVNATNIDTATLDTATLKIGGDNYVPTQIVLANGQTLTVLAKQ